MPPEVTAVLLVRTVVAPSRIQGLGLFAAEDVPAGAPVWEYAPGLDQLIPVERIPTLPPAFQDYLARYAYPTPEFPGFVVLSCDHAKFMNHSDDPAIESRGQASYARRAIPAGEEITCDYGAFVSGWEGFS